MCSNGVLCLLTFAGMDPMVKTELVDSLSKMLVSAGILNAEPSHVRRY